MGSVWVLGMVVGRGMGTGMGMVWVVRMAGMGTGMEAAQTSIDWSHLVVQALYYVHGESAFLQLLPHTRPQTHVGRHPALHHERRGPTAE